MSIRNDIAKYLKNPSHIVKISDKNKGLRLKKETALAMRYAYSYNDIINEFGTIDNLLNELPQQGFENATFLFQKTYGTIKNTTYHTINIKNVMFKNNSNTQTYNTNFLGGSEVGNNMQFLGALVESERAGDYKKQNLELEERIKDYRSENRTLREDNHRLKLKLETSEERAELKLQTELLNRKGLLESEGAQKALEGLGAILPQVVPAILNGSNSAAQLGGVTEELSPIKSQTIELLKHKEDKEVAFLAFVMQNNSSELMEVISNYIQNNNG